MGPLKPLESHGRKTVEVSQYSLLTCMYRYIETQRINKWDTRRRERERAASELGHIGFHIFNAWLRGPPAHSFSHLYSWPTSISRNFVQCSDRCMSCKISYLPYSEGILQARVRRYTAWLPPDPQRTWTRRVTQISESCRREKIITLYSILHNAVSPRCDRGSLSVVRVNSVL
jgi:hypothetical protein